MSLATSIPITRLDINRQLGYGKGPGLRVAGSAQRVVAGPIGGEIW